MRSILTKFLVGLAAVLTLIVSAPIALHIYSVVTGAQVMANAGEEEDWQLSDILSRLSILPRRTHDRPLVAVIVENHEDARPHQTGLKGALLIAEFFVEGGISRFAVLHDLRSLPETIGPVRSLRPYFVDALAPWINVILFAGGSPEAFERLDTVPTLWHFNGLGFPQHFVRDEDIAAPHNLFLPGDKAQDLIHDDVKTVRWPPYSLGRQQSGSSALLISLDFLSSTHDVTFEFNRLTHSYTRTNGDIVSEAHPQNVLILEAPIAGVGEHGRLTIPLTGRGDALLFRGGTILRGIWKKSANASSFTFEDTDGDPMRFGSGQTWMVVLPTLRRVSWN
ncbi:MAG: DUF3048 domain-containing protein [Candidatus Peregrinibacteria bacterium]|nr:DUF3048 domain-containing protein [Candidatus Peregrinibacteria bacterium]